MPIPKVQVFATGGTIDKRYGGRFEFDGSSAVAEILTRAHAAHCANLSAPIHVRSLFQVDSSEMTLEQRLQIVHACAFESATRIVVTHGTDTLLQTAEALHEPSEPQWRDRLASKVVVLTGSFQPAIARETDADFNLGFAIAAAACLPGAGIYVAMNGFVLPWNQVAHPPGRFTPDEQPA